MGHCPDPANCPECQANRAKNQELAERYRAEGDRERRRLIRAAAGGAFVSLLAGELGLDPGRRVPGWRERPHRERSAPTAADAVRLERAAAKRARKEARRAN